MPASAPPPDQLLPAIVSILGRLIDVALAGVSILLAPERAASLRNALTPAVRRRLHRCSDDELVALGKLLWLELTRLLEDLPPSRRGTIFSAVTSSVDLVRACSPPSYSPYSLANCGRASSADA